MLCVRLRGLPAASSSPPPWALPCRTDPALQELHRRVPFIAVYDDHEIADSAHTQASRGVAGR